MDVVLYMYWSAIHGKAKGYSELIMPLKSYNVVRGYDQRRRKATKRF